MLEQVTIRNFTIAATIEWELHKGFHVITGETGAGKSILFDALMLCLGGRGDASMVRVGCDKAEISAHFSIALHPPALQFLAEHELTQDDECIITRTIGNDGRSRSYINGRPCPQQLIRNLSSKLVNFCGQHEHQRLLKKEHQRSFLDTFSGNQRELLEVKTIYQEWQEAHHRLEALRLAGRDPSRIDFLRFQLDELTELNLKPNEALEIQTLQKRQANAQQLQETCETTLAILRNDDTYNIISLLHQCQQKLLSFSEEIGLNNARALLESAAIQLSEASDDIEAFYENITLDPDELQKLEERLNKIYDIARKHHVKISELDTLTLELSTKLDLAQSAEAQIDALQHDIITLEKKYHESAVRLSQTRQTAAEKLKDNITTLIKKLGMPHADFFISCTQKSEPTPSPLGNDVIEFHITTNPGIPSQPLAKIASGGELSRLCLAIQVCNAAAIDTPTLLFDEVDVGISGKTSQIVGQLLRQLGKEIQIICVTHQPQVIASADHHFRVEKITTSDATHTELTLLKKDERLNELARILGGIDITKQTLAHAKEMLELNTH